MAEDAISSIVIQIKKYVEFARRLLWRWWIIAIFSVIGIGGSVGFALKATRIYQSRTLIAWKQAVDESSIGREAGWRPDNWLHHEINQLISSHTLLWKIANDFDLYPKMREAVAPEVILEQMQDAITYGVVGGDSFWLAFEYKEPAVAQKVTAYLAERFIRKNVDEKQGAAAATSRFMEQEAAKVKQQLDAIESELAQFVADHPEFKPDPTTGLPRGPSGGRSGSTQRRYAVVASSPELKAALERKGALEAQLQLASNPRSDRALVQAQEDLSRARQALLGLRQKYTDRHPDVQQALRYVAQLESQVKKATQSHSTGSDKARTLRAQLAAVDAEIERLSKASRTPARRDAPEEEKLKESALSAPAQLEKRWYLMTGEREVTRAKYEQISNQLLRSKLAGSLEDAKALNEFTIVDPANLPGKPIKPSRVKIVLAGSALGIMLGFGLAALLVILDPRIYSEDDLRKACDLPVLAQIPKEV